MHKLACPRQRVYSFRIFANERRAFFLRKEIKLRWKMALTPQSLSLFTCTEFSFGRDDVLIQDALHALVGITGVHLRKDAALGRFKLNSEGSALLAETQRRMLLRLTEAGNYYTTLVACFYARVGGSIRQGFMEAVRRECIEYSGAVSMLQDWHNARNALPPEKRLTLFELLTWYIAPLERLQWLLKLTQACTPLHGGALIMELAPYRRHGAPEVRRLAAALLRSACQPLLQMLALWLLEGRLSDEHDEFFIEQVPTATEKPSTTTEVASTRAELSSTTTEKPSITTQLSSTTTKLSSSTIEQATQCRIWHDKYRLRLGSLPGIIQHDLALEILTAGKSIDFLRTMGANLPLTPSGQRLLTCIASEPGHIYAILPDTPLHEAIHEVCGDIAEHLLDNLTGAQNLHEQLSAMRRYLLLGRADLLLILMASMQSTSITRSDEMLAEQLDAALHCVAESYEKPEILTHVSVHVNTLAPAEPRVQAIDMRYQLEPALAALLGPSMPHYEEIFRQLWQLKRAEFTLTGDVWQQLHQRRRPIVYALHSLANAMLCCVKQIEYHFLFEVIECAWAQFRSSLSRIKTTDELLKAHDAYLRSIRQGCFLEPSSEQITHSIRNIYENVSSLAAFQAQPANDSLEKLTVVFKHNVSELIVALRQSADPHSVDFAMDLASLMLC